MPGWESVTYDVMLQHDDERINAFLRVVRGLYANGACVLARLRATDPRAFDAALRTDLRGLDHMLASLLRNPGIVRALDTLRLDEAEAVPPPYHVSGVCELEGALVDRLVAGGAYSLGRTPEAGARDLCREFVAAIRGDGEVPHAIFAISGAWTPWFFDVAWDSTFLVCDAEHRTWWVLVMTDTDRPNEPNKLLATDGSGSLANQIRSTRCPGELEYGAGHRRLVPRGIALGPDLVRPTPPRLTAARGCPTLFAMIGQLCRARRP